MPDAEHIARAKSELRLKSRAARRSVMPELHAAASLAVMQAVLALPEMQRATAVLAYGAMPEEIDATGIIEALWDRGVRVALPRVKGRRELELHWHERGRALCTGAYGLQEPCEKAPVALPSEIDALVVPGVAYDAECRRLGLGAGYYDTLLARLPESTVTIGVAFDEQMVAAVPCGEKDRPVDILVTPTRVIRRS
ncbi:MAG: 5-formyltetrahydrofolate cyclo-ligase [Actinomycetota bacterium]|nr:5-formyltetrahydrofolate cyclo-ligase [Actinomycetota bacterium]MDP3629340.1 5-formyltetrahydrofolate cyclo-ligase [Actinomycetota bacterium]MDZ4232897.1 5-formyltetrahydrofolate cyclo-ligase [Dietzia sp.]